MARNILICTVGTSLFYPNLSQLVPDDPDPRRTRLAVSFSGNDWSDIGDTLSQFDPTERICGAEINSVASIINKGYAAPDCSIHLYRSDTEAGRVIASILQAYFRRRGHGFVDVHTVEGLQDQDPRLFRTLGLRNLTKRVCQVIRDYGPKNCAINATGGYKAQIAIAVMMGQAIGVPVYYKHERFDEIIAFPPMPVALDFEVWLGASGMLFNLDHRRDLVAAELYQDEWDERYESLVERVDIDGRCYLELSPAGQIFHETFCARVRSHADAILPPGVATSDKKPPKLEDAGWPGQHPEVERLMKAVTRDVPQVKHCRTCYYNPDLPQHTRFRLGSHGIEGIVSDGTYTAKFIVETTAQNDDQRTALVSVLNQWLADQHLLSPVSKGG